MKPTPTNDFTDSRAEYELLRGRFTPPGKEASVANLAWGHGSSRFPRMSH
jgi:hypothetical protein